MRASVLCTCFLLGMGVAGAEPSPAPDKQETEVGRVKLDDDAAKTAQPPPRTPSQWLEIATPTPAKHGTEFVVVGAVQGAFSRLRIDATTGRTVVKSVRVRFSDGTKKTYNVSTTVSDRGRGFAMVDLGVTKPIDQVAITTDTKTKGTYAVYGSSGAGNGTAVSSR